MTPNPLSEAPSDWRAPSLLLALRLSIAFVLDVAQISRGAGDLLDPLILTAMLEANQAAVRHEPRLAALYGDAARALPDELRRPISVNALAKSLRMPFENVRRRVKAWVQAGLCVQTADGVYVPQAVVTSAAYLEVQAARVERLERFQRELEKAELLSAAPPDALPLGRMARAADRALGEYMLRSCDRLMTLARGPVSGFVLLGLCAVNAQRLPAGTPFTFAEIGPQARPCSAVLLAHSIAIPEETVRRHLLALSAHGLVHRTAAGWLACAPPELVPELGLMVVENARDLRRLFMQLGDLGRACAPHSPEQET